MGATVHDAPRAHHAAGDQTLAARAVQDLVGHVRLARAALGRRAFASHLHAGTVFNAGNDVSTQSRQISNLISQGVDGIVINAASTSGLNGVVQQACDRCITIVSFDNTVDNACVLTVNTDQVKFGEQLAQFIVDKLNGQGNVVMVTGVASGIVLDLQRLGHEGRLELGAN